jgi:predicted dehydrogenase
MSAPSPAVLIIGCGSIGERHLRCFGLTRRARVTACDTNPELLRRMGDAYGVPTVADWSEAVRSGGYQAAVICTPAPSHIPIALEVLRQGMHVLIEKPLSHSLAQVDTLLAAVQPPAPVAAVAYVFHQFPYLREARDFLLGGQLGAIRQVISLSGQPFHRLRPGYARSYYRDRASGGGAIQDALTHTVNWVESVVGPAESVLCDCAHLHLPEVEVEDTVHVSARHGAVLANYTLSQFQTPNENFLQFNATGGSVRIELHRQRWGVWAEGAADWTWHEVPVADRDSHFVSQANALLDAMAGQPARLCSVAAAAQTLRFNLAALQSAASDRRVFCSDLHA